MLGLSLRLITFLIDLAVVWIEGHQRHEIRAKGVHLRALLGADIGLQVRQQVDLFDEVWNRDLICEEGLCRFLYLVSASSSGEVGGQHPTNFLVHLLRVIKFLNDLLTRGAFHH